MRREWLRIIAISIHDPMCGCIDRHANDPATRFTSASRRLGLSGWNDHLAAEHHHIIGHAIGLADRGCGDIVLRADARKRIEWMAEAAVSSLRSARARSKEAVRRALCWMLRSWWCCDRKRQAHRKRYWLDR
jgi:hypothetical protein